VLFSGLSYGALHNVYVAAPCHAICARFAQAGIEPGHREVWRAKGDHNIALWPAAYEMPLLEHVVLTALIVERSRLMEAAFSRITEAAVRKTRSTFSYS
jgi:hypothetical protein